eukprot:TRINITY_DN14868_c0_g1_i1.p2 TRINITY_DN14868_c0_g1~~TRINITY_DN14868_c0_g1_i1.p2  ORF type:complete len:244 (+),score=1.84 TRINITY_DN14868_c0_g1_i1:67-798(+)
MTTRELISPEGLRIDGRRPNELRQMKVRMGLFSRADGSVYYQQGNTKLLVAVYGPREVSKAKAGDAATINCEFVMAPFGAGERRKRRGDRRAEDIALVVKQVFEAVVMVDLLPNSQIDVYINAIQVDGGVKCAAINAATLALIDAGIPMTDFVAACSGSCVDSVPLVDLNHYEDTSGCPDMVLALLPKSNKITLLQMDHKLHMDVFEKVLKVGIEGCQRTYEILLAQVRERTARLVAARGVFT